MAKSVWRDKHVVIFGATCPLGESFAEIFAQDQARLTLIGRDRQKLDRMVSALGKCTNQNIKTNLLDIDKPFDPGSAIDNCVKKSGAIDGAVFCIGAAHLLQFDRHSGPEINKQIVNANFNAIASMLLPLAEHMGRKKDGFIIITGSVGGSENYIKKFLPAALASGMYTIEEYLRVLSYTTSKLYLHRLVSDLRKSAIKGNVRILTLMPATIDTESAAGIRNIFPKTHPRAIAEAALKALKREAHTLYVPWYWQWILGSLRLIPLRVLTLICVLRK